MRIAAFIFARGGSKGLPKKNLKLLRGAPLVGIAIQQAKVVSRIEEVFVSTDCEEIAAVAREYGATVPFLRPANLAQDDSPEILAWKHALNELKLQRGAYPEIILSLPATSPLRSVEDINACLDMYLKYKPDLVITVADSFRNPYFNMVRMDSENNAELVIKPPKKIYRRQDAPTVYDVTTVAFVARSSFVLDTESLYDGSIRAVKIPHERSIDIDNISDFEYAEYLAGKLG
jgi:CMP-N-acetylneuraminic acid synthetase